MATQSMKSLGSRVRAMRIARGLTQKDIADPFQVNSMQISRWEGGLAPIPADKLAQLAGLMGVTQDFLETEPDLSEFTLCLRQQGFQTLGEPKVLEKDNPSVVAIEVLGGPELAQVRAWALYGPAFGVKQLAQLPKHLRGSQTVHYVIFVSELPPDPELRQAATEEPSTPSLCVTSLSALRSSMLSLRPLAEVYARGRDKARAEELRPKLAFVRSSDPPLEYRAFLNLWVRGQAPLTHLLVVGEAGSGKSTMFSRFVADQAAMHLESPSEHLCPVLVPLYSWWDTNDYRGRLIETIQDHVTHATRGAIERALEDGKLLLVLDGLDELVGPDPARLPLVERALDPLLRTGCPVLISSRQPILFQRDAGGRLLPQPNGELEPRPVVRIATVHGLDLADARTYIAHCNPSRAAGLLQRLEQPGWLECARLPYMLNALLEADRSDNPQGADPAPNIVAVQEQLFQRWAQRDAPQFGLCTEDLWRLLGHLAAEMRRRSKPFCTSSDLNPTLRGFLFPEHSQPHSLGTQVRNRNSLILSWSGDRVRFVNTLVADFFFATWVCDQIREDEPEHLGDLWLTRPDLNLLVHMLRDPEIANRLVDWMIHPQSSPPLRDLTAYLLAFTRQPGLALARLRQVSEQADRRSLSESADFARMVLGDEELLAEILRRALGTEHSRLRLTARLQLVALVNHAHLLHPSVQQAVLGAWQRLPRAETCQEMMVLSREQEEAVTTRASACDALGVLGDQSARELLERIVQSHVACVPLERSPTTMRLARAARQALEQLDTVATSGLTP